MKENFKRRQRYYPPNKTSWKRTKTWRKWKRKKGSTQKSGGYPHQNKGIPENENRKIPSKTISGQKPKPMTSL
jgi:hypothetical protein